MLPSKLWKVNIACVYWFDFEFLAMNLGIELSIHAMKDGL